MLIDPSYCPVSSFCRFTLHDSVEKTIPTIITSFPFEFDVPLNTSKRCLQSATAAFRLGKFTKAIALLDESPQPELLQIAVRKSEIYIAQRDFRSTRQTLDAALVRDPNKHPNGLVPAATAYDLLRLIRGFVRIFNELKLKKAVETAREAKKRWLNNTEFSDYSELQIYVDRTRTKLITEAYMDLLRSR